MNVCSGTLTLESGSVVKVNGTTVASPVVVDGSIASSTRCVWEAGTTGEWDTNANWITGAAPSAENAVVLRTANATISVSANSTAGAISVDESTTIAGTAAALASFATKVTSITVASGKTLTLSCTDSGTYTFSKAIVGAGSFAVSGGTVTLSGASTFLGNMIVCANTKAIAGASGYAGDGGSGPFGPKVTAASVASATRRVEVLSGGTIDMNGKDEMRYFFKLAGNGDGNGALINTGSEVGTGKANVSGIELSGDASIGGSGNFGIIAGGYNTTVFDLAGHTLSKKGNNTVWVSNGSKKADSTKGTLKVEAGVLSVYDGGPSYNRTTDLSDTAVQVAGGTLTVDGAFNIGALTQNGGTITVNASKTFTVADTVTVNNGGEMEVNGTLSLSKAGNSVFTGATIANGGTLGVNGYVYVSNPYNRVQIDGNLDISGAFDSQADAVVSSTGVVTVRGNGTLWLSYKLTNNGNVSMPNVKVSLYSAEFSPKNGYRNIINNATVTLVPTGSDVGVNIGDLATYITGSGAIVFDVSTLSSLPTGTDKLTLFSTTTALDLTKFSVTGNSDYYLQQNAQNAETAPGAVTLQLHAAKDSEGNYYDNLGAIFQALGANRVLIILDGQGATYAETFSADYDDTSKELFHAVAQIGETKYPSLSAAFSAATDGQTVTLLKVSCEAGVALNDKSITFSENGKAFGGTLTGNGTITVSAAPSSTTWTSARFAEGWTGTFVIDWEFASQSSDTQWIMDNYGLTGSKVQVNNEIKQGCFSTPGNAAPSINPAVFFDSSVSVNNGWNGSTTTFAQIGMATGATFNTRGHGSDPCTYAFTEVKDFAGTVSVNGQDTVAIGTVILDAEPTIGSCILKVNKAENATVNLGNTKIKVGSGEAEAIPIIYSGTMIPTGLYLPAASATTSGSVTTTHASIEEAVIAAGDNGTVTILANVNIVTVNPSQTVVVADGVTVGTISWGDEYATVTSVTGDGTTSYASTAKATTYYWKGPTGSAWSTVGNWAVDAADGATATRAPTSIDSVVFNNGASVNMTGTKSVNGIEINGSVTIAGGGELKTSGNVTAGDSGSLTLNNVCLTTLSSGITVAPAVNFANDSEIGGDYSLTINGNVTISDSFKAWGGSDVDHHKMTGYVTINSGANFSSGGAWVDVNGDATVKGNFTSGNSKFKFCSGLTIEAGRVTANGSNVNVDSDAISVVLAGLSAEFEDTRGQKIDDSKVATTVPHGDVKKTGSIYSVSRCGAIFSVY